MKSAGDIVWNICPIRYAGAAFADRWSFVILRDVLLKGRRTYGEFLDGGERIATNILANRLGGLVSSGILERLKDPRNRRKVLYLPTAKGRALVPVLLAMIDWSARFDECSEVSDEFIEGYRADPVGFAGNILKQIELRNLEVLPESN